MAVGALVLVNRHRACKYSNQGMRASTGRRAWGAAALVAAVFSVLALAPSAQAAFGLNGLSATPASTDAGANSDLTINIGVTDPEADLRDLTIHLPPGLVGNPLATSMCTVEQLNADALPAGRRRSDDVQQRQRLPGGGASGADPADGQRHDLQRRPSTRRAGSVRDRPQAAQRPPAARHPATDHPSVRRQPAAVGPRTRHGAQRPAEGDTLGGAVLLDITGLSLTLNGHGRLAAAGLHPPADLVQDPHGRLRRHRLRRADGKRLGHLRRPPTAARCRSRPSSAPGSSASDRSTSRSS